MRGHGVPLSETWVTLPPCYRRTSRSGVSAMLSHAVPSRAGTVTGADRPCSRGGRHGGASGGRASCAHLVWRSRYHIAAGLSDTTNRAVSTGTPQRR